jgi:hypothetical protein
MFPLRQGGELIESAKQQLRMRRKDDFSAFPKKRILLPYPLNFPYGQDYRRNIRNATKKYLNPS